MQSPDWSKWYIGLARPFRTDERTNNDPWVRRKTRQIGALRQLPMMYSEGGEEKASSLIGVFWVKAKEETVISHLASSFPTISFPFYCFKWRLHYRFYFHLRRHCDSLRNPDNKKNWSVLTRESNLFGVWLCLIAIQTVTWFHCSKILQGKLLNLSFVVTLHSLPNTILPVLQ